MCIYEQKMSAPLRPNKWEYDVVLWSRSMLNIQQVPWNKRFEILVLWTTLLADDRHEMFDNGDVGLALLLTWTHMSQIYLLCWSWGISPGFKITMILVVPAHWICIRCENEGIKSIGFSSYAVPELRQSRKLPLLPSKLALETPWIWNKQMCPVLLTCASNGWNSHGIK